MYLVLDASPLIYLAKLDAFDAVAIAGHVAVVPSSVYAETARPELAFRHPEVAIIERIHIDGQLLVVSPELAETELATELAGRAAARYGTPGLHAVMADILRGHGNAWMSAA